MTLPIGRPNHFKVIPIGREKPVGVNGMSCLHSIGYDHCAVLKFKLQVYLQNYCKGVWYYLARIYPQNQTSNIQGEPYVWIENPVEYKAI